MLANDSLHCIQPEAGTLADALGRKKWIEDMAPNLFMVPGPLSPISTTTFSSCRNAGPLEYAVQCAHRLTAADVTCKTNQTPRRSRIRENFIRLSIAASITKNSPNSLRIMEYMCVSTRRSVYALAVRSAFVLPAQQGPQIQIRRSASCGEPQSKVGVLAAPSIPRYRRHHRLMDSPPCLWPNHWDERHPRSSGTRHRLLCRGRLVMIAIDAAQQTDAKTVPYNSWTIDPASSAARFEVNYSMTTNVKGMFSGLSGVLKRDESAHHGRRLQQGDPRPRFSVSQAFFGQVRVPPHHWGNRTQLAPGSPTGICQGRNRC